METFAPGMVLGWMIVTLVTDEELANPTFLRDVRVFLAKLRLRRRAIVDWLVDGVRDAKTNLVDAHGNPASIDFEELERVNIDLWMREWATFPTAGGVSG